MLKVGGAMRDRTADLLDANQALSQLSYSPKRRVSSYLRNQAIEVGTLLKQSALMSNAYQGKHPRAGISLRR